MVKAGKWFKNFLTGKKEKRQEKEIEKSEWLQLPPPPPPPPTTPKEKTRRNFNQEMEKYNPKEQFTFFFVPELYQGRYGVAVASATEPAVHLAKGARRKSRVIFHNSSMEQRAMERNTWPSGDALSAVRSDEGRQSMDSTNNEQFVKSASSRGGGINKSFRTVSRNSSRGKSTSVITNESIQDSLGRISYRGSKRRGSYSLSRDLGDQMLESISLSRELVGQMFGEVDSSIVAQIGDGGYRTIGHEEDDNELENLGIPTDNVNNTENGLKRSSIDVKIVSDGSPTKPSGANVGSPAYLLEEDSSFPFPADLMLHSIRRGLRPDGSARSTST